MKSWKEKYNKSKYIGGKEQYRTQATTTREEIKGDIWNRSALVALLWQRKGQVKGSLWCKNHVLSQENELAYGRMTEIEMQQNSQIRDLRRKREQRRLSHAGVNSIAAYRGQINCCFKFQIHKVKSATSLAIKTT